MKTTYNGTYTQVDELESVEGVLILKQRLKDNAMQDSFVRSNFLSGARFLQNLKHPSLLAIDEVIDTSEEVSIVCKNDGFQQLGVYLETQSQLSDAFIVELIQKMLRCLDYLHQNSLFHQGLNPNSFVVNKQGEVKLTLFGTLEHRLYHHLPAIGDENPSIQNAMRFYSPERKVNYGAINLASENYSFGLIIWYLKCVQLKLTNTTDLVLNFPEYSSTGSVWDKVIEACLQEDPKKRPKSAKELLSLLPPIENNEQHLKKKTSINDEPQQPQKKVLISLFNYNSFHHQVKVDGKGLECFSNWTEDRKLVIQVCEGNEIQIFSLENGILIHSAKCINEYQFYLPVLNDKKNVTTQIPINTNKKTIGNIAIVIVIVILGVIFYRSGNHTKYNDTHSGNLMEIPDGFILSDTLFSSVLTKEGYQLKSGQRWRYNNGEWEKCELVKSQCEWENIQDESLKKYLDDFFFRRINQNGYKFNDKEIKQFIFNYYRFLDQGDRINELQNFFEPILIRYYKNKYASYRYVYNEIASVLNQNTVNHDINKNSIFIDFFPDSAVVRFKLIYNKTSKFDSSYKSVPVSVSLVLSKNLKISSIYANK